MAEADETVNLCCLWGFALTVLKPFSFRHGNNLRYSDEADALQSDVYQFLPKISLIYGLRAWDHFMTGFCPKSESTYCYHSTTTRQSHHKTAGFA